MGGTLQRSHSFKSRCVVLNERKREKSIQNGPSKTRLFTRAHSKERRLHSPTVQSSSALRSGVITAFTYWISTFLRLSSQWFPLLVGYCRCCEYLRWYFTLKDSSRHIHMDEIVRKSAHLDWRLYWRWLLCCWWSTMYCQERHRNSHDWVRFYGSLFVQEKSLSGRMVLAEIMLIFIATLLAVALMYVQSSGVHSGQPPPEWLMKLCCMHGCGRNRCWAHATDDSEVIGAQGHYKVRTVFFKEIYAFNCRDYLATVTKIPKRCRCTDVVVV